MNPDITQDIGDIAAFTRRRAKAEKGAGIVVLILLAIFGLPIILFTVAVLASLIGL